MAYIFSYSIIANITAWWLWILWVIISFPPLYYHAGALICNLVYGKYTRRLVRAGIDIVWYYRLDTIIAPTILSVQSDHLTHKNAYQVNASGHWLR